jgi:protein TonB
LTTYVTPSARDRPSTSRRALSFALAVAIEVLLLLAFLTINLRDRKRPEFEGGRLTTFDIANDQADSAKAAPKQSEPVIKLPPRPVPQIPKPKIELPPRKLDLLEVSKEFLETADISKLGSNAPGYSSSASRGSPGDSDRVGTAPNGEPLYAAEWYREPTNQELAAYLPRNMPESGGWGLVACRTAPRFKVEDCEELGQSPAGSHLAGAVRKAAWQFLVRPPRVGGKSLVGTWVRIRIDYSVSKEARETIQ